MWKISFNQKEKKVERFNNKATVVTLTARVEIPEEFISYMPQTIYKWLENQVNFMIGQSYDNKLLLKANGKVVRDDNDEDNPILAERIAECKAKMKIYNFMTKLTGKYCEFYIKLMSGNKNGMVYTREVNKGSLHDANIAYCKLWHREKEQLQYLYDSIK